MSDNDLFSNDNPVVEDNTPDVEKEADNQPDFLSQLVGEGKKFRDVQALAKGKIEGDSFIEDLVRQNKELREELNKQEYAKELLQTMKTENRLPTPTETSEDNTMSKAVGSHNPDGGVDIESIVERTLSKREKEQMAAANKTAVSTKLREVWGDKAKDLLVERAKEMDVELEDIAEMAARSPKALFRMLGITNEQVAKPNVPPRGDRNPFAVEARSDVVNDRTWAYYEEMRKANKRKYFSPDVQRQLLEDKRRLGDRFGMPS